MVKYEALLYYAWHLTVKPWQPSQHSAWDAERHWDLEILPQATSLAAQGPVLIAHWRKKFTRCDWWFAGTVGDLYKALAEACGVSALEPNNVLLLVEIVQGLVNRKYTDLQEPLADAICRQSLLAYQYATDAKGPASGGKELHVFQRCSFPTLCGWQNRLIWLWFCRLLLVQKIE